MLTKANNCTTVFECEIYLDSGGVIWTIGVLREYKTFSWDSLQQGPTIFR